MEPGGQRMITTDNIFFRMADLTEKLCGSEPFRAKPKGEWSFGEHVARILCKEDRQHVAPIIYGLPGVGKSTTAISIMMSTAKSMARMNGGNPIDYFNPEEDIFIEDEEDELDKRIAKSFRHLFLKDEATLMNDARDSMKKENKQRAKAAATIRDRRCGVFTCSQLKSIVDKRISGLATHEIQIVEDHHDEGYNVVKIKKLYLVDVDKEPYRTYLTPNGYDRIVRHIIYAPDDEIYQQYNSRRKESVAKIVSKNPDVKPISDSRAKKDAQCAAAWKYYLDMSHSYVSLNKAATSHGIDVKTLQRWMADPERGLDVKGTPIVLASQRGEDPEEE